MISLSVAISHVDRDSHRRVWVARARRRLSPIEATVVLDTERSLWHTCRRAYAEAAASTASHHLVLADDMMPCLQFPELLLAALTERPDEIVTLFSMRRCIGDALARNLAWVETSDCSFGGAVVMPTPVVREFLDWELEHVAAEEHHDDTRIAAFAEATGRSIFLTAPSLVEHMAPARSLVGQSNSRRVAFAYSDGSPIDWATGALRATPCGRASAIRFKVA